MPGAVSYFRRGMMVFFRGERRQRAATDFENSSDGRRRILRTAAAGGDGFRERRRRAATDFENSGDDNGLATADNGIRAAANFDNGGDGRRQRRQRDINV